MEASEVLQAGRAAELLCFLCHGCSLKGRSSSVGAFIASLGAFIP